MSTSFQDSTRQPRKFAPPPPRTFTSPPPPPPPAESSYGSHTFADEFPGRTEVPMDEADLFLAKTLKIPEVVYRKVLRQESGGNDNALSPRNAQGRMQIIPSTFKLYAAEIKRKTGEEADINNPLHNSYAGLRYMQDNYNQFKGRAKSERHAWMMASAAYHAGPGRVQDDLEYGSGLGIPDVDDGLINTRDYIYSIYGDTKQEDFIIPGGDHEQKLTVAQSMPAPTYSRRVSINLNEAPGGVDVSAWFNREVLLRAGYKPDVVDEYFKRYPDTGGMADDKSRGASADELRKEANASGEISTEIPDYVLKRLDEVLNDPDAERVEVHASKQEQSQEQQSQTAMRIPPVPHAELINIHSSEGRAERDAQRAAEGDPNISDRIGVQLPEKWLDLSSRNVAEMAARKYAESQGIPETFANEWLVKHPEINLYGQGGQPAALTDLVASPSFDDRTRTLYVRGQLPQLSQMRRDYEESRGVVGRAVDKVTSDETTAGEKFIGGVGSAVDYATRPLGALSTGAAGLQRSVSTSIGAMAGDDESQKVMDADIYSPVNIVKATWNRFRTGEVPEGFEQPIAQGLDLLYQKKNKMPLPTWRRMALEIIGDPMTYASLNLAGDAAKALKGTRLRQKFTPRGLTVLDIERATDDGSSYLIKLKDAEGVEHTINTPTIMTTGQRMSKLARDTRDVINLTKAIPASFDMSALMSQGGIVALSRPSLIKGAMIDAARSARSKKVFETFKDDLLNHPNAGLREDSGLYLASIGQGEETFGSRFAQKIPGVAASERAYEATLDNLRVHSFDLYADQLTKAGVTDPKAFKDIARWVNVATGRGEMGRLEPLADILNLPMFSPRLLASKFNILSPVRYARMHPAARKIAMTEMFRALRTLAVTMGLATLAGATVDLDPFSGGFGRITHGQTSYDLSGGRLRTLRFAAQIADTMNRQATGEKVKSDRYVSALTTKFFRAYLSPVGALGIDAATDEEFDGKPFEWKPGELQRLIPFAIQDMREGYKRAGMIGGLKASPSLLGIGVQTFEEQRGRGRRRGRR